MYVYMTSLYRYTINSLRDVHYCLIQSNTLGLDFLQYVNNTAYYSYLPKWQTVYKYQYCILLLIQYTVLVLVYCLPEGKLYSAFAI